MPFCGTKGMSFSSSLPTVGMARYNMLTAHMCKQWRPYRYLLVLPGPVMSLLEMSGTHLHHFTFVQQTIYMCVSVLYSRLPTCVYQCCTADYLHVCISAVQQTIYMCVSVLYSTHTKVRAAFVYFPNSFHLFPTERTCI